MKKTKGIFTILFFSIIVLNGCFSIPALGINTSVTIENNIGSDISVAAMYPAGSSDASDIHYFIRAGDYSLRNGDKKSFNIPKTSAFTRYTFTVLNTNNVAFLKSNVSITHGMTLSFTQSDLSSYQPSQGTASDITAQSSPSVPAIYRIGDTGPAGGLIFYDKGNNSQGWRYLEAAPYEAEFQAVWSVRDTRVENTQEAIGNGRRNTQLIIEAFTRAIGEWDTAAQYCDELVFNGFDDWFLPSKD
jgi:hypothetical protein